MRIRTLLIFILLANAAAAQKGGRDSVLVFKLRNPESNYSIWPEDSVLQANKKTIIKIHSSSPEKKFKVKLEGASIIFRDSIYQVCADTAELALLTILEYQKRRWRPVKTKLYRVKHPPEPYVIVCGVKADSVIDKQQLIAEDRVEVFAGQYHRYLPVKGFSFIFLNGPSMDTLYSSNSHFTLEMRRRVQFLKPGDLIYFEKVKCSLPDGSVKILRTIQLYVDQTNKYKVGYRIVGKSK